MADTAVRLSLDYHSAGQEEIFECPARYVVAPCGRRYGKTEGAFRRLVDFAVLAEGSSARGMFHGVKFTRQLWVDTTQGNIEKYFARYLEPILKPLGDKFKWNKQMKVLTFWNGSVIHFGSAENPENLEGFAYDIVWLNETGHILGGPKGERLWSSTILPMTIEGRGGKGAQVFFLGTPKDIQYGPGLFRKMALRGEDPNDKDVRTFRRSSYDNPFLTPGLIKEIFEEIKPNEVRQEVYGEFEDQAGRNMVVPFSVALEALTRQAPPGDGYWPVWGLDVARGGADDSALAKRRHLRLLEPVKTRPDLRDGNEVADWVAHEFNDTELDERPRSIFVDEIGYGSAALDVGRRIGLPMIGVNVSRKPINEERFFRKRDELWFLSAAWCEKGSLAGDNDLMRELTMAGYGYQPGTQKLKVESKDELKKLGHASPNRADAFNLTFSGGNELRPSNRPAQRAGSRWGRQQGTWMSA